MMFTLTETALRLVAAEMKLMRDAISRDGGVDQARLAELRRILKEDCLQRWDYSAMTLIACDRRSRWWGDKADFAKEPRGFEPVELSSDNLWLHLRNQEKLEGVRIVLEQAFKAGFIVAGGAVCDLLCGKTKVNDLDLFAPGMTGDEAEKAFDAMVSKLPGKWNVFQTNYCITAACEAASGRRALSVQMITRTYKTPEHVVYGFDLAPCAVAWDGEAVTATIEAEYLAYQLGVFTIDMVTRRGRLEHRIAKYVYKGFALVLPDMKQGAHPNALSRLYVSTCGSKRSKDLPANCWPISCIEPEWMPRSQACGSEEVAPGNSDYGAVEYTDRSSVIDFNIRKLVRGGDYFVWERVNGSLQVVLGDETANLEQRLTNYLTCDGCARIDTLKRRVGQLTELLDKHILAEDASKAARRASKLPELTLALVMEGPRVTNASALAELALVTDAMVKITNKVTKPSWKPATEGTNIAAGFTPAAETITLREWYGEGCFSDEGYRTASFDWIKTKAEQLRNVAKYCRNAARDEKVAAAVPKQLEADNLKDSDEEFEDISAEAKAMVEQTEAVTTDLLTAPADRAAPVERQFPIPPISAIVVVGGHRFIIKTRSTPVVSLRTEDDTTTIELLQ